VTAPQPTHTADPPFSKAARENRIEGRVVASLIVEADGRVSSVMILQARGYGLDEEAAKSLRMWRFKPAMRDGQPVPVQVNVEINFRNWQQ
jgi:protein TonB